MALRIRVPSLGTGVTGTTWNPADKNASIVLSNGNLTAAHSGAFGPEGVRSTTSHASGKYVFKFSAMAVSSSTGDDAISLANATAALDNWGGDGTDITSLFFIGDIYNNGSAIATASGATGPWYAVDIDNGTIRTSANGTTWNGPYTFTMPAGALFIYAVLATTSASLTLDPAPTGWTLSGFSNWAGSSGTTTTLTPGSGSLTIGGQSPQLKTTLAPGTGSLTITGQQPTLGGSITVTPGTGSLTITGQSPQLTTKLSPGTQALAVTGQAATAALGLNPGTQAVVITGQAVVVGRGLNPGTQALAITGQSPALTTFLNPGTGSLAITGQQALLGGLTSISPGTGSLIIGGQSPQLKTTLSPGTGALAISGQSPVLSTFLSPGTVALTITGQGASLKTTLSPGSGALTITGQLATVTIIAGSQFLFPGSGTLTINGQRPTISGVRSLKSPAVRVRYVT